MWKRVSEGWLWVAAAINLVLSIGLATLLVHYGFRWAYMMDRPLDASNSVLLLTVIFSVFSGILALILDPLIACRRFDTCEATGNLSEK